MGAEATPAKPQPRVKSKTPSRVKPSKTLLQFAKKKRKRTTSEGSDIDMDATPPPSPTEEESGIEKRRSGRNASSKRKKYVDDVQMTFSDEDGIKGLPKEVSGVASAAMLDDLLGPIKDPEKTDGEKNSQQADSEVVSSSPQSGPNYAFIAPTAEDTMIVQYILTSRMGSRELEDSEDESELPKAENDVKEESKPTATDAQETDTKAEEQKENDDHEKKNDDHEKEKEEKTEVVKDEAIEEIKDLKDIKDG